MDYHMRKAFDEYITDSLKIEIEVVGKENWLGDRKHFLEVKLLLKGKGDEWDQVSEDCVALEQILDP